MKIFSKLLSFLCVIVFSFSFLAGCGENLPVIDDGGEQEQVNPLKTQLYVANFNGGFGKKWLQNLKVEFERKYADISFESGKTGVQIMPDNRKVTGETWLTDMERSINDVFFTEWLYLGDHLSQKKLLDITDIVTGDLNESDVIESITGKKENLGDENEGSIADKLTDIQKNYYSRNGVYYALPHYQAYTTLIYDVDLFEDEKLYFAADRNNGNDGFIIKSTDERSLGPDGKTGVISGIDYSADDGLPATFEEFYNLCYYMQNTKSITPLAWTGSNQVYVSEFVNVLMAHLCGADEFELNFTMDGTSKTLLDDDGVTPLPDTLIDSSNGYILARQKGKLQAFEFIKGIISGGYYDNSHCFSACSHLKMQDDFLWSRFSSAEKDIAMIIEGNWWENEAEATWEAMKDVPNAKKSERRLGLLPLPWATSDQIGSNPAYLESLYSGCFIKANVSEAKKPLAKLFLQFVNTNRALAEFTMASGQPRSFNYTLTNEQYDSLTYFQKKCWDIHVNADFVRPYSTNAVYNFAPKEFSTSHFNNSTYLGVAQRMSHDSMRINPKITAYDYWKGTVELNDKATWEKNYKTVYAPQN